MDIKFQLEEVDRTLAENPFKVVEDGGYIFSLLVDGEVIGVCALFNEGDGIFEWARMAADLNHQGLRFGKKLIDTCFKKLKEIQAKKVFWF